MSELDMGEQFGRIIEPRLDSIQKKAGGRAAQLISNKMKDNVESGQGFGNDEFDASYSESHAKKRRRKGLSTGRVNLKMGRRRINQTQVETTDQHSEIRFPEGGDIFKLHHEGRAKGGKTRSIFPKTPESIPDDITDEIKSIVRGVLSG